MKAVRASPWDSPAVKYRSIGPIEKLLIVSDAGRGHEKERGFRKSFTFLRVSAPPCCKGLAFAPGFRRTADDPRYNDKSPEMSRRDFERARARKGRDWREQGL